MTKTARLEDWKEQCRAESRAKIPPTTMSTLQPRDLILKRQDRADRTEYLLYQYDGTLLLKQVGGPWSSEAEALHISLQKWATVGDVYYETEPNGLRVISG